MKKKFSTVTVVIIAFLMMATGVYAGSNWKGSGNVAKIKDNLDQISIKMGELKDSATNEQGQTIREIEILLEKETALRKQKEGDLQDKQTEIENKIAEIQEKVAENNRLKGELAEAVQKAQKVGELEAEVERLNRELAVVTTDRNALKLELEQALRDVQEIERITQEMVDEQ